MVQVRTKIWSTSFLIALKFLSMRGLNFKRHVFFDITKILPDLNQFSSSSDFFSNVSEAPLTQNLGRYPSARRPLGSEGGAV
jgi:hypothetical protein